MYLIVGLGNPDLKYLTTYHNLGFMALDKFASDNGLEISLKEKKSLVCKTVINGEKVILAKPLTYMNLSGEAVVELVNYYKIPISNVLVVYDDLDIPKASVRIRKNGSAGTHNGMRNIVKMLNTTDFPRIRIGSKMDENCPIPIIDYVLSEIDKNSLPLYKQAFEKVSKAVYDFISGKKLDKIMGEYNG